MTNTGLDKLEIHKLVEKLEIFIHKITKRFSVDEKYSSVNQLRRSSFSVTDNITEGYRRYSFQDKINKFCIARGEAEENINSLRRRQTLKSSALKSSSARCFTLIEMLVVVSITAFISVAVFANMRAGGYSKDLNSSVEKLAGVIKQAQMMALSGKQIDSSRPDGGYGVYFDTSTNPNSYKLFANTNNPESGAGSYEYDASDTVIQTITLSQKINMTPAQKSIVFKPPYGPIYVGNGSGGSPLIGSSTLLILLQHFDANFYGYIRVNSQGEIDVRKTE